MVLTSMIIRPNAERQRLTGIYDVMDICEVFGQSACVSPAPYRPHLISSNVVDKHARVPAKQSLNGGLCLVGQYKFQRRVHQTRTTRRWEPDHLLFTAVIDRAAKRILIEQ
jgi:hypothetical protein